MCEYGDSPLTTHSIAQEIHLVGKFASTDGFTGDTAADDAGVIHALIQDKTDLGPSGTLLRLALPLPISDAPLGQFFLARPCPDDGLARRTNWSLYARRPLYVADRLPQSNGGITQCSLLLPNSDPAHENAGDRWIRSQLPDTRLNLTGPFGRALTFAPHQRALLVVTDLNHLLLCLPAIHYLLDQNGRATLILHTDVSPPAAILQRIPIPVEVRTTADLASLQEAITATLRWADTMLVALPQLSTT